MNIKKNGFYTLKKEFLTKINDKNIPRKEKRPVYYCIEDKRNKDIFWVVPMTSQINKANKFISKYGANKCYNFEINTTMPNSVFNIQDIFPITKKYIDKEYLVSGKHYIIKDRHLIESIERKAQKFISMGMVGKKPFPTSINIVRIKKILEQELQLDKLKQMILDIKEKNNKVQYNCLTGVQIQIPERENGDNRWISLSCIEKENIQLKEGTEATEGLLCGRDRDGSLKLKIGKYYNASDIIMTEKLKQKLVLMREVTQEKTFTKGKNKDMEIER